MKHLFLVLAIATGLLSSCSNIKWTHGTWTGTAKQIDNATYEVKLDVSANDEFVIEYPDLMCMGSWKVIGNGTEQIKTKDANGKYEKLILRETIEHGTGNCDQGVEVHLIATDNSNEIKVLYFIRSYDAENPVAEALLKRQ